ncbi:uncharacterized protein Z519_09325 [Cladophialophora bantiana CBS 173.52]|uniref:Uncharacterized protein n=1 Tax=Cladophialophora bantiana (strain ATCC 10958 / CBS 173.52 / CDC B-1940 / NIH 8579) TaxID=1442370 RepID=A0A0D2EIK9_CLAB1|nr:uncharacterized protein Z519_09325 [Cladophialophora bantiana CBS 173.52]KIW89896.1 hypothetical protein Z519_09325 [Cladophialophora bantiana CBS 173.52]
MANHASSVKAEPAQPAAHGINKGEASTQSVTSQTGTVKDQVAASQGDDRSSTKLAGSARKQTRAPPTFSVAMEKDVREMMNKARKVLHGKETRTKTEEDYKSMALLATNLVQLMNASFIATDTIVRAIAYMRGDSQLSARSSIFQARRDRRAQKVAERLLDDVKNSVLNTISPNGAEARTKAAVSNAKATPNNTQVSVEVGPNQRDTALGNEDQQQRPQSLQTKANKKKRNYRRPIRNRKDSAILKVHEHKAGVADNTVGGADESKDNVNKKTTAAEHKPETSGEETAVEGDGVAVAIKA